MANSFHYEVWGWVWNAKKAEYEIVILTSSKSYTEALGVYEQTRIDGNIAQCELIEDDGETVERLALKDSTGEYEEGEW